MRAAGPPRTSGGPCTYTPSNRLRWPASDSIDSLPPMLTKHWYGARPFNSRMFDVQPLETIHDSGSHPRIPAVFLSFSLFTFCLRNRICHEDSITHRHARSPGQHKFRLHQRCLGTRGTGVFPPTDVLRTPSPLSMHSKPNTVLPCQSHSDRWFRFLVDLMWTFFGVTTLRT